MAISFLLITILLLIDNYITLPSVVVSIGVQVSIILAILGFTKFLFYMNKELDYMKAWDYIKNTYQYNVGNVKEVEEQELETCLEKHMILLSQNKLKEKYE